MRISEVRFSGWKSIDWVNVFRLWSVRTKFSVQESRSVLVTCILDIPQVFELFLNTQIVYLDILVLHNTTAYALYRNNATPSRPRELSSAVFAMRHACPKYEHLLLSSIVRKLVNYETVTNHFYDTIRETLESRLPPSPCSDLSSRYIIPITTEMSVYTWWK